MTTHLLYPILVTRQFIYRMWGGQRLTHWLHLTDPPTESLGETWEVFDTNTIRNGTLRGQTLMQATQTYKEQLIGTRLFERYGADFPLLLKFIDANDKLSIQVHPDDAYAHIHEAATGFHGKTECWYILDAKPGAEVIHGLREPMNRESFTEAVREGGLEHLVKVVSVQAGDVIFTPPGMLHAINDGILLFEIQQKSDLTYRVYDYGRRDPATGRRRKLHLKKALDVLRYAHTDQPKSCPVALEPGHERVLLAACKHFVLEKWLLNRSRTLATDPTTMDIYTVIEGQARVHWDGGQVGVVTGDSVIVPAVLGAYQFLPDTPTCTLLRVYVPDVEHEICDLLRTQGVNDGCIADVVFDV